MPEQKIEKHPLYIQNFPIWQRCIDITNGQDSVHEQGEKYLPRLTAQDEQSYQAYKQRARFFNASKLTVKGYVGLVARKPAVSDSGDNDLLENFMDSVNLNDIKADEYLLRVLEHVIITGRCATLVDYTSEDPNEIKGVDGSRHIWSFYEARDILNWKFEQGKIIHVTLKEISSEGLVQYRMLILDNGIYRQDLYKEKEKQQTGGEKNTNDDSEIEFVKSITPLKAGKTFDFIPIVFHTNTLSGQFVDNPPILDLVNLNLSHYQVKADHMHILHYLALPTPYMIGVNPDEAPSSIGPQKIWVFSDPGVNVGILEMSGGGVSAIAAELATIEEQMAKSGARILQPNTEKTATASNIASMSETSILGTIVKGINDDANRLLMITENWLGISGDVNDIVGILNLNDDFFPASLESNMLLALISAWQQGAITHNDLFIKLKQGEIIDESKTFEDHIDELQDEGGGTAPSPILPDDEGDEDE